MKRYFILLLLICSTVLAFTACSKTGDMSPDEIKGLITSDIDTVESELTTIEDEGKTATGDAAVDLADDAHYLTHRLDDILGTFDRDVEDGYITDQERKDYEQRIGELQDRLNTTTADLTTKAGDKASEINPDSKALKISTKDDLDALIKDDDQMITGFEAGIGTASSSTRETFKTMVEQRLDGINSAMDDLDKLEENGTIDTDEKDSYERQLKELRKRFDDLDYQL